jgi:hypothetical protein
MASIDDSVSTTMCGRMMNIYPKAENGYLDKHYYNAIAGLRLQESGDCKHETG